MAVALGVEEGLESVKSLRGGLGEDEAEWSGVG